MKLLYTIAFIFVLCLPELSGSSFCYALHSIITEDKKQGLNRIPVLCYHHITKESEKENPLWIGEERFNGHIKMLRDSGYHTILPEQLYRHFTKGTALPSRPILITFDDTHEAQFSIAKSVLDRYGFKGVFFIMTVCIGKKNYMTAGQIKTLAENGHAIGAHTYDHPFVTTLKGNEWEKQIDKPKQILERMTGQPVEYFAYPNGLWNDVAIGELKTRGIKAAFQLTGKQSKTEPLFTLQRLMVSGQWSSAVLHRNIKVIFKEVINNRENFRR